MEIKKLEDMDLEEVSGGGLFSCCSYEDYVAAGVEVIGWGYIYNDGYKLKSTGEELKMAEARWAVIFYKEVGRRAKSKAEINKYCDACNSGTSWSDSSQWG